MSELNVNWINDVKETLVRFIDLPKFADVNKTSSFSLIWSVDALCLIASRGSAMDASNGSSVCADVKRVRDNAVIIEALRKAEAEILTSIEIMRRDVARGLFFKYEDKRDSSDKMKLFSKMKNYVKFVVAGFIAVGEKPHIDLFQYIAVGNDVRSIARSFPSLITAMWFQEALPADLIFKTESLPCRKDVAIVSLMAYGLHGDSERLGLYNSLWLGRANHPNAYGSFIHDGRRVPTGDLDAMKQEVLSALEASRQVDKMLPARQKKKNIQQRDGAQGEQSKLNSSGVPLKKDAPLDLGIPKGDTGRRGNRRGHGGKAGDKKGEVTDSDQTIPIVGTTSSTNMPAAIIPSTSGADIKAKDPQSNKCSDFEED